MRMRCLSFLQIFGVFLLTLAVSACTGTQTSTTGMVMLDGKTYLVRSESRREMGDPTGSSFAVSVDGGAGQWLPVGTAHGIGSISVVAVVNSDGGAPNEEFKRVFDAWYDDKTARKNVQTQSRQYYLDGYGPPGADSTDRTIRPDGSGNDSDKGGD